MLGSFFVHVEDLLRKGQGMPLNRLQVMAMKEDGVMERAVLESLEELFVRVG